MASGAPIDGFGVGTALDVSSDAPSLDCAYKLQEYAGKARRKRSEGKATWPGRKQVYRKYDSVDGCMMGDVVTLEEDNSYDGEPLVIPVMLAGERINGNTGLDEIRRRTLTNYSRLPAQMTALEVAQAYPVEISLSLRALAKKLDEDIGAFSRQTQTL